MKHLNRIHYVIITAFAVMTFSGNVLAGEPSDSLHFKLTSGTSFIEGTRDLANQSQEEATFDFQMQWDVAEDSIVFIIAEVKYNSANWSFVKVDPVNWPDPEGFGIISQDTLADTITLGLQWASLHDSLIFPAPTDYTTFATITLTPLCQVESNTLPTAFTQSTIGNMIVTRANGDPDDSSPDASNYIDGTVTTADYVGNYSIGVIDTTGAAGTEVWVPITSTTNYRCAAVNSIVTFDGSRLEYVEVSVTDSAARWTGALTSIVGDSITVLLQDTLGSGNSNEMAGDTLYRIKFKVLCDSADINVPTLLGFRSDSHDTVMNCASLTPGVFPGVGGSVEFDNAVTIKGVLTDNSVRVGKSNNGQNVRWAVLMKNTIAVADTNELFLNGEGISLAIDLSDKALEPESDSTFGFHDLTFDDIDNANGDQIWIFQDSTGASGNFVPISNSFDTLLTFERCFDSSGFVAPSWAGRFLTPRLMHEIIMPTTTEKSSVPEINGCRVADSVNGLLVVPGFMPFEGVEVIMASFENAGYVSTSACGADTLKILNNFDVDTFSVTYQVNTNFCISGITLLEDDLVATEINDQTWKISSETGFAGFGPRIIALKIAIISLGARSDIQPGGPPPNQRGPVGFNPVRQDIPEITVNALLDDAGAEQFGVCDTNLVENKLSEFGVGCGTCPALPKLAGGAILPQVFALDQNYPNPFNPTTKINLTMPTASKWNITIYNVMGQKVESFSGESEAGVVTVEWDASAVASGMYFYKATAGDFQATRKMVLLK